MPTRSSGPPCSTEPATAIAPLRARVDKLLAAHAAAGGILDQPPIESPPTDVFHSITEGPGTIIGPYKLIQ